MHRYVVNLTHNDEHPMPHSFSEGRYGHVVRAENMTGALAATIDRAKRDGYYGHDWRALVTLLDPSGRRCYVGLDASRQAEICLFDGRDPEDAFLDELDRELSTRH